MRVFCALPPVLRKQGASSGLFLKAAALTLCLGERRKLEALKAVLHLLPDCFSEALLELEPVPLSGAQGTSGSDDSSSGGICALSWVLRTHQSGPLACRACRKASSGVPVVLS